MAKLKFIDNKKLKLTVSEAVQKLIKDCIKKNELYQPWHLSRLEKFWNLEVHDMLEANKNTIKKFMTWWIETISKKIGRKAVHLDEIISKPKKGEKAIATPMIDQIPRGYTKTIREEC